MKSKQIPWVRVFLEGTVIVGSILLAFGIQAWWDGSRERAEERQALEALDLDFRVAADRLDRQLAVVDSIETGARTILRWTGPNADSRYADSLALFLPAVTRLPTFQPPLGTLDALLGSGDLRLIRNDDLRAALASLPSQLAAMHRTESYGSESLFGDFRPYLIESIPMRLFGRGGDGISRFPADVPGLLGSLEFENQLQSRLTNTGFLRGSMERMRQVITDILAQLEAELGA